MARRVFNLRKWSRALTSALNALHAVMPPSIARKTAMRSSKRLHVDQLGARKSYDQFNCQLTLCIESHISCAVTCRRFHFAPPKRINQSSTSRFVWMKEWTALTHFFTAVCVTSPACPMLLKWSAMCGGAPGGVGGAPGGGRARRAAASAGNAGSWKCECGTYFSRRLFTVPFRWRESI